MKEYILKIDAFVFSYRDDDIGADAGRFWESL